MNGVEATGFCVSPGAVITTVYPVAPDTALQFSFIVVFVTLLLETDTLSNVVELELLFLFELSIFRIYHTFCSLKNKSQKIGLKISENTP